MSQVDHVVYGVRDLDEASARLRAEYGLDSGGVNAFPGTGAANRVVVLGDQYLELLAIVDQDEARATPMGRGLLYRLAEGDSFLAWALSADDLDAVADRVGLEPQPFRMTAANGETLTWRLVGMAEAFAEPGLPFFIQWDDPDAFASNLAQGRAAARHTIQAIGIDWIAISGDEGRLREYIGTVDARVRITSGPPSITAVGIATPDGEVVIRG